MRPYTVRLIGELPPAQVIVNGTVYPYSLIPKPETWSYDPIDLAVVISIPSFNTSEMSFDGKNNTVIQIIPTKYPGNPSLSGVRGVIQRSALAKVLNFLQT